jgi:hypothetical protein
VTVTPLDKHLHRQADVPRFGARAWHALDLDNLTGKPDASANLMGMTWGGYRSGVPTTGGDHFVVACCGLSAVTAMTILPPQGVRLVVRDGKDGAENAVLESTDWSHVAARFDRVVIGSGDHAWIPMAEYFRASGLYVHLVTGIGGASRDLLRAAHSHARLRFPDGVRKGIERHNRELRRAGVMRTYSAA